MKPLALIFVLFILCGSTASQTTSATTPKSVEDFCDVMAAPKQFQRKTITLQASAHVLYGGILLKSSRCKAQDVTMHFMYEYEKKSDAAALEVINRLQTKVWDATLRGEDRKARQALLNVVLEGRLDKNPYYHLKIARGDRTLAAWDYNYQYAFVVTRIVSARPVE